MIAAVLQQSPKFVLGKAYVLDDLLQEPARQLLAVYRDHGRAFRRRMPQQHVARGLLRLSHEACPFKRPDDLLRPRAGQARKHTYAMMGVLTVMPSDTGFALSISSGIRSP